MARNRVIGSGNALPWRLPDDLKHFKALTIGGVVIMGRKTCESLGRPLPDRRSIVISRNPSLGACNGCAVVHSWNAAVAMAGAVAEIFVIGGASLYAQTISFADRMYLTLVHAEIDGDAYFPEFASEQWQQTSRDDRPADSRNPYAYSFLVLDRVADVRR